MIWPPETSIYTASELTSMSNLPVKPSNIMAIPIFCDHKFWKIIHYMKCTFIFNLLLIRAFGAIFEL